MLLKHHPVFLVATACIVMVTATSAVASASASAPTIPRPHIYRIGKGDVTGWRVAEIGASRRENNWRAWHDAQPESNYFYRGSWQTLRRVTGWYERLALSSGPAEAHTVVLVSQFSTNAGAQRAYHAILPSTTSLVPLAIGTQAAEWQTNAGVASGPHGLAGYFGGFTTFLQAGGIVVEIHADVGGRQGAILRPPLPNPGRAIARRLARISTGV